MMNETAMDLWNALSYERKIAVLEWLGDAGQIRDAEEEAHESLAECIDPVRICGADYCPMATLKAIDPIAYRQAINEYVEHFYCEIVNPEDRTTVHVFACDLADAIRDSEEA